MQTLLQFIKANFAHWALIAFSGAVVASFNGIPQLQPWAPVAEKVLVVLNLGGAVALPKMTIGQ